MFGKTSSRSKKIWFENKLQQVCGHLSSTQTFLRAVHCSLHESGASWVTCLVTGAVHYWYPLWCRDVMVWTRSRWQVAMVTSLFCLCSVSVVSCCTKNRIQPHHHINSLEFACNFGHREANLFEAQMTPPQFIGSQPYRPSTICWNHYKGRVLVCW